MVNTNNWWKNYWWKRTNYYGDSNNQQLFCFLFIMVKRWTTTRDPCNSTVSQRELRNAAVASVRQPQVTVVLKHCCCERFQSFGIWGKMHLFPWNPLFSLHRSSSDGIPDRVKVHSYIRAHGKGEDAQSRELGRGQSWKMRSNFQPRTKEAYAFLNCTCSWGVKGTQENAQVNL